MIWLPDYRFLNSLIGIDCVYESMPADLQKSLPFACPFHLLTTFYLIIDPELFITHITPDNNLIRPRTPHNHSNIFPNRYLCSNRSVLYIQSKLTCLFYSESQYFRAEPLRVDRLYQKRVIFSLQPAIKI